MENKINVAMLGSFPPLRGISSYCYELATSMADSHRCRVDFISFKKMYPRMLYPGKDLLDDPTFPNFSSANLHVRRNICWYNPFGWLTEGLKSKASLLHAQWWSLPLAPIYVFIGMLYKLRGKPLVFTVHNVLSHERSRLYSLLSRWLFALGDHFIVHSELNRQQLGKIYEIPPDRISLIPHGPLDLQVKNDVDRNVIRDQLGFLPNHKVILLFGAIRPYKGVDIAIEAFARIKNRLPDARLLIVGKAWEDWEPYERRIKKLGIENEVIVHLGYIPSAQVYRYFTAADLVVLPYHHFDSQSGVGSTAVAFRKPMIVTRVGGLADLVLDPRAVIPENNPGALAEAVIAVLRDGTRLKKMIKDADTIAGTMSWDNIVKQTIAVYERLLNKPVPISFNPQNLRL